MWRWKVVGTKGLDVGGGWGRGGRSRSWTPNKSGIVGRDEEMDKEREMRGTDRDRNEDTKTGGRMNGKKQETRDKIRTWFNG